MLDLRGPTYPYTIASVVVVLAFLCRFLGRLLGRFLGRFLVIIVFEKRYIFMV